MQKSNTVKAGERTQHTPGPWEIHRGYSKTHATPIRWQGENLAWVCGLDSAHEFTKEQTAANARLIAAAPELLKALQGIMEYAHLGAHCSDIDVNEQPQFVNVRAAIAKAEGKI